MTFRPTSFNPLSTVLVIVVGIFSIAFSPTAIAQNLTKHIYILPSESPRNAMYAKFPGHYELSARSLNATVNPGESINIEVFITGYGDIKTGKLFTSFPSKFVEEGDQSFSTTNLLVLDNNTKEIYFSGPKMYAAETGIIIRLFDNVDKMVAIFDAGLIDNNKKNIKSEIISTEIKIKNAPIELHLKTQNDVLPGNYIIKLYFTYFNGVNWNTSTQNISIEVPSWLKRNEIYLWVFGTILVILSLIQDVYFMHEKIKTWYNKNDVIASKKKNKK